FSPGFRWGPTLLPGDPIRYEDLLDQTAITYPYVTKNPLTGETIKTILEDVADNLFNPDPYYQQGGDMVRVGGLRYSIDPFQSIGHRITRMELRGQPIEPGKQYSVAGWAPVTEAAKEAGGEPVWDVVARYLRTTKTVTPRVPNTPVLEGVRSDPGLA
ncbi:MAG TPA: 5'-nucleotidase C-terminal domain-containing protein, partial [Casimicrobiaceae bacterium]|nr:5'-nucleotidase C-terminal domain-containing protein [Casimicrobiaceae bacterium]